MGILLDAPYLKAGLPPTVLALVVFLILRSVFIAFRASLRNLPGPNIARFTPFYRLLKISKGDAPIYYLNLHKKYGPIVRTGPNTVDISDPQALQVIYGINSQFLKVSFSSQDRGMD